MMDEHYARRTLERSLVEVSAQFPIVLLTGPRQVGKTTLLRHLAGDERGYVTLDDLSARELANADPVLFLQRHPPPLLIDEIQYAPPLLPQIKIWVDSHSQPGAFWLTGSQRFQLMRDISESLAGRVAVVQMLGFSLRERERRRIDVSPFIPTDEVIAQRTGSAGRTALDPVFESIWLGSFPRLATGEVTNRDLFYASYLQTYIQRDVSDLAQVGDQSAFVRFVRVCAARTGQLLRLSELARDADVSPPTARRWLGILEASFQVFLLQPFHTNRTKRLVKAPKLYFLDTGFCSYLTGWTSPQTLAAGAMAGAVFETWVLGEILRSWWHHAREPQLSYYRDRDQREVDLLFERDGKLHPVEIKLGASPRMEWVKHFGALDALGVSVGPGAVISLAPEPMALSRTVTAFPAGAL